MFSFYEKAKSGGRPTDTVLFNEGLLLALEWGEQWLEPINERILKKYPTLSETEVETLNKICQRARSEGLSLVLGLAQKWSGDVSQSEFQRLFKEMFPLAETKSMGSVFSQGMYYAWKEGYISAK